MLKSGVKNTHWGCSSKVEQLTVNQHTEERYLPSPPLIKEVLFMKRKKIPSPPKWFELDTDNCYMCKNRKGCHGCKFLKKYVQNTSKSRNKTIY